MISREEIDLFKENGYTFEEIESIKKGIKNIDEGNTILEEDFWNNVYTKINTKMKEHA